MIYSKLYIPVVLLFVFTVIGCKKMDSTYAEFLEGGEKIYISKADSLKAFVGRDRIQLQWLLLSDPKVRKYKVYWNNRADSVEGELNKTENVDTVKVMISNLPEGSYNFEVLQYDNKGNTSISTEVVGRSYGALYAGSLYNRSYKLINREGSDVQVIWGPADETLESVEVQYIDNKDMTRTLVFPASDELSIIPDFPQGGQFTYKTYYVPDTLFVDKFSSPAEQFEEVLSEKESDKAKFKHYPLPTDTYQPLFDSWGIKNLWDGISDHVDHIFYVSENAPNLKLPNWFTINLGEKKTLSKVRVNQLSHADAWLFSSGAPKTYEIYGSNAPNNNGSFDGWHLLGSYESVKPSNSAGLTAEDIAVGRVGEYQSFVGNIDQYQYIRFKVNSTWGGVMNVMLSELTFYEIGSTFKKIIK